MIEKVILDHIKASLDVPVFMEEPESPPKRYILIEKVGGGEKNGLFTATLTLKSYAESLYQAAALNERVKDSARRLNTLDDIGKVTLNSDYSHPDMETKRHRYQAVIDVYF